MRVFFCSKGSYQIEDPIAVALGTFDGIHVAHQMLIRQLEFIKKTIGCASTVYTFTNNPLDILNPKEMPSRIMTTREKIKGFSDFDIDYLLLDTFNKKLAGLTPREFIRNIILDHYDVKYIVVGYDFKFGAQGSGDIKLLKKLGDIYGFQVIIVPPLSLDSQIISSSLIRSLIKNGQIQRVSMYLGNSYSMTGRVVKGFGRGVKLGFPTANIDFDNRKTIPKKGVYLTKVRINGIYHWGMTNVGRNPTFNKEGLFIETHIIDYRGNLYGKVLTIEFIQRIRGEKKFLNIEELKSQINKDIQWAEKCIYKFRPL